jgi:hypothetical protein
MGIAAALAPVSAASASDLMVSAQSLVELAEAVSDLRTSCYDYKKGYLNSAVAWANCAALASISSCSKSN